MTKAELIKTLENVPDDSPVYVLCLDKEGEYISYPIESTDEVEDWSDKKQAYVAAGLIYLKGI